MRLAMAAVAMFALRLGAQPPAAATPAPMVASAQRDVSEVPALQRMVTVDLADQPRTTALQTIARLGHVSITFATDLQGLSQHVTAHLGRVTLATALLAVLNDSPLRAVANPSGDIVVLRRDPPEDPPAPQPTGMLAGRVSDAQTNEPISDATVQVLETSAHAVTNADGSYHVVGLPAGAYRVTAQRIGFQALTLSVTIVADQQATLDFKLTAVPSALTQVVVTASKAPTQVRDVPAPVEVVPATIIQQSGAQTLMQVVQTTTGVTAAQFGENFQSIQLRGLPRLGNENETVLILIDGVPQTDARNSAQINNIPVNMIDQVEVVRGPSSALYGRTAIGGTINILTPQPTPQPEFTANAEVGDLGYVRGSATATGSLGSQNGYVVSWQGDRHDGFAFPTLQRQSEALFGKFVSTPDDKTNIMVTGNYVTNYGGTPTPIPIQNGQLLSNIDPALFYTNLNLPYAQYNQEDVRTTLRVKRALAEGFGVTNTFGYRHSRYDFLNDGDVLSPPASGSFDVLLFPFTSHREEDAYFNDLQLEGRFGPTALRNRLIAGVSFERNTGNRNSILPYGPGPADSIQDGVYIDYRNPQYPGLYNLRGVDIGGSAYYTTFYSAYIQDELAFFDRLRLSFGGRFDLNEISSHAILGGTQTPQNGTYRKFTPKVSLSYRVLNGETASDDQLSVYVQYAQGFLPPPSSVDPQSLAPTSPTPETITNYEGGFKGSLLRGLLSFDASAFWLQRDGIELQVRTGGNTFATSNGGVEKFPGIEAGVNSQITSDVMLFAKYAYYGAHFGSYRFNSNGTDYDFTGNRVALAPKDNYDIGADLSGPAGFGLYVDGHFSGSAYLDYANTFLLPSYFVTNARLSWQFHRYTAAVVVSNIFDEKYLTDGDLSTAQFAFAGAPRRVIFQLGAKF
jgi:iron complex outermembrane receptor protein